MTAASVRRNVTILQRILPEYRHSFFRALRDILLSADIDLTVVYGDERPGTVPRTVPIASEWAQHCRNIYLPLGSLELVWQSMPRAISPDLVVVEHSARLARNYLLQLRRQLVGRPLIGYWGHGRNFQVEATSAIERIKRMTVSWPDWWFAYTDLTRDILIESGYPQTRISVVNNSIDTKNFEHALREVTGRDKALLCQSLSVPPNAAVGLFCGGLNQRKRIPFLLEAASRIKSALPEFHLLVVGDGPEEGLVRKAAQANPWIHYLGPSYGEERARYFAISDVMLMPGLVGLAIVDAFCASLPLVTTNIPIHSPEIAYLEPGNNGLMTIFDVAEFARETVSLLRDRQRLSSMSEVARESSARLSIETMAARFAQGIVDCLSLTNK